MEIGLNICRLCQKPTSIGVTNLFEIKDGIKYADQVLEMLNIELEDTPGWPSSGCSICIYFLDKMKEFKGLSAQQRKGNETSSQDDNLACNLCFKITPEIMIDVPQSHNDVLGTKVVSDMLSMDVKDPSEWPANGCWECIDFLEKVIIFQKRTLASHNSLTTRSRDPPLHINNSTVSRIKKPPKTIVTPRKPPTYNSLVRHIENATPEELRLEELMLEMRLFVCRVCHLDCSNFRALKGHVRSTHDYEEYKVCCEHRLKGSPSCLYDHFRIHLDPDAFKCDVCGSQLKSSSILRSHMNSYHSSEPPLYSCNVCGKGFSCKSRYGKHMSTHEEKIKCQYCERAYSNKQTLSTHVKMEHEVEVNCLCHLCGKGFPSINRLNTHIKDHGGAKRRRKDKMDRREDNSEGINEIVIVEEVVWDK